MPSILDAAGAEKDRKDESVLEWPDYTVHRGQTTRIAPVPAVDAGAGTVEQTIS